MNLRFCIFTLLCLSPQLQQAQSLEFTIESLYPIVTNRQVPQNEDPGIKAGVQLYSDGEVLTLVVEVEDESFVNHPNYRFSDRVEISFALAKDAYPDNFEYQFHPHYIAAEPIRTRGESVPPRPRFFSAYSEYTQQINRKSFIQDFDYPRQESIIRDSLLLPIPPLLKNAIVPYGIVRFALFPDNRPPIHLNRRDMSWIEQGMSIKLGDLEAGIEYIAEEREHGDGYVITATFSPQALGFVQLPELKSLRFLVDILKSPGANQSSRPVLSTVAQREINRPTTYNLVRLRTPLNTNFTPVPNQVFSKVDFSPMAIYTMDDWLPCQVEVEGLLFQEGVFSQQLTEVGFVTQPFRYESFMLNNVQAERFLIRSMHLNRLPHEQEYIIFGNQVLKSERVLLEGLQIPRIQEDLFLFPDGFPGLISHSIVSLNPYGWGPEGQQADQMLIVQKVYPEGSASLLTVRQSSGANASLQIGNLRYPGYFMSHLDWVREGEVMVLRLSRYDSQEKKRIKVAFLNNGSEVEISEVK